MMVKWKTKNQQSSRHQDMSVKLPLILDGKAVDRQVKVDERYITTEIGPITLGPGEVLDVIDEKEKGEINVYQGN